MPLEGILGRKVGMTQLFMEGGEAVPVSIIEAGPCVVLQVKTPERDGYAAVQLGFGEKRKARSAKSELGHAAKAKASPQYFVREVQWVGSPEAAEAGQTVTVAALDGVKRVDVIGTSKGRGWAGVMKRHNFSGGDKTHGSKSHRRPGSIGMHTFPSRVLKGQRMSGHMGNARTTVRNLDIVRIEPERNLLFVRGGVPGPNGRYLVVRRAISETQRAAAGAKG